MTMSVKKFFLDSHDHRTHTFPAGISKEDFGAFFLEKYLRAANDADVVVLRTHVGLADGRAYCFNMAPSAEHVRRAHEAAGLPYETITEVTTASPADLFLQAPQPKR
jgi:hypothetical protein